MKDAKDADIQSWFYRTGIYEPGKGYYDIPEMHTSESEYRHRAEIVKRLREERRLLANADDVHGMIQKDKQIDRVFATVENREKLSSMV